MSKIIDSLKASVKELSRAQTAPQDAEHSASRELTQEQLAEIYFSQGRQNRTEQPLVIKVIEKERVTPVLPWLFASLAFLVMALALFSTKRLLVDIRVIDDTTLTTSEWSRTPTSPPAASWTGIPLEDFQFEGAAKVRSSKTSRELTLVNSTVAPFAKASLFFRQPEDLSGSRVVFQAKGASGGEKLAVAVKDRGNRLAYEKGKHYPFPQGLTAEWQRAELTFDRAPEGFDATAITSLRFEFGTRDADNRPGDTIYVKDLRVEAL